MGGKIMSMAERLVVAIDVSPRKCGGVPGARKAARELMKKFSNGLYITVKFNSVLRGDYSLIKEAHQLGLRVFADLKLFDIPATLKLDGEFLSYYKPEIVTVACQSEESMRALRQALPPETEVLAITTLTSEKAAKKDALIETGFFSKEAGLDGLVLAGKELKEAKRAFGHQLSLNVPGIRPKGFAVSGDDQKRIVTPTEAILAGADRVIVGRPITQAQDPRSAALMVLEEIIEAVGKRNGKFK